MKDSVFWGKKISLALLLPVLVLTAALSAFGAWRIAGSAYKAGADGTAQESRSTDKILVLYTNDMHCSIEADAQSFGLSGLAAAKEWAQRMSQYVTLADCGDAIQGEAAGLLSRGSCMVDLMNELGYDICTFGNHEFDYGMEQILELVNNRSKAAYISCNFVEQKTGAAVAEPYVIMDYDGLSVAYVGVSTPQTLVSSQPSSFMDEHGEYLYGFCQGEDGARFYHAVQSAVDSARQDGADYVVAIAHLGIDESASPYRSTDLIRHTTGIDAVLDGHSHSVIPCERVNNKDGKEVLLSSSGSRLANIGCLLIDTKGTAALSDDVLDTVLLSKETVQNMEQSVGEVLSAYETLLEEVVAYSDVRLSANSENGNRMVRNRETAIGNFCADACRSVSGADLAVVNGGGIRAGLAAGELTYGDLFAVFPYGNMLSVVTASKQDILDMLEMAYKDVQAAAETEDGAVGEFGGFLQVSGMRVVIDTGIPSSVRLDENGMFASVSGRRRVTDVQVFNSVTGEYEPLDDAKTYTLAANDYMLHEGGDGFSMFMRHAFVKDRFIQDTQALADYITKDLAGKVGAAYGDVQGRILVK
ncbi:MAG: bifunctional metallophosphatase/5'-nucleotidase [Eubacterium sp.]|nr:bifunctional metallophosphatase/5'-nucleotidase [Eubacterium sp.]